MCFTYHLVLIHMSYSNVQTGKQKNKIKPGSQCTSHLMGKENYLYHVIFLYSKYLMNMVLLIVF